MSITIGPKGPRGPIGPPGEPGDDYVPVMTELGPNIAIVTDTVTSFPPDIGKYWVPFTSIIEAYNNPAIEHIILHKTQPEVLPPGFTIADRTIYIQAMTPSCPVQIPDNLTNSTFVVTDVEVMTSSVTMSGSNLRILTSRSIPGESITFNNVESSTVRILESTLDINQIYARASTEVIILSSRLTIASDDLFNVISSTVMSTGNVYSFLPTGPVRLISADSTGYIISSTHDTLRLTDSSTLDASSTQGLGLMSAMSVISDVLTSVDVDRTTVPESIIQPVDVNGEFSGTLYNRSEWYGYSLFNLDASITSYIAIPEDRFIQSINASIDLRSIEYPGKEVVLSFTASASARTIITTEWTYNVPLSSFRVKLIRMDGRWVQFGV